MPKIATFALVFLIGLLGGFIDSTTGSGGLITIPSLIFLGLPPIVAIATDRLGTVGQALGALPKYWQAKKVGWSYVLPFSALALIGSFVGSRLLLSFDQNSLQKVIGLLLLLLLPLIFLKSANSSQGKHFGFKAWFRLLYLFSSDDLQWLLRDRRWASFHLQLSFLFWA